MSDENGPVKKNKRFGGADLYVMPPGSLYWIIDIDTYSALVKRSDDAQRDFQSFVCDNSKFSRDEKGALEIDSAAAFDQFLGLTVNVKHEFDAVREHRVGQKAQNFAASAHDVLQHVEPIVQLVKDFGHPFGGMAIGTISFLLVVCRYTVRSMAYCADLKPLDCQESSGYGEEHHHHSSSDQGQSTRLEGVSTHL